MHLVYITAEMPFGSGETFFAPEIREILKHGHRVTVVPIRPRRLASHDDARSLIGFSIAEPVLSLSVLGGALAEIMRAPLRVTRCARQLASARSIGVFLKNWVVFPKGLWLAGVAKRIGADHIHAQWASTSATAGLVASTLSGIPWSFTAHRWDISARNLLELKAQTAEFVRTIDIRGAQELAGLLGSSHHKLHVIHLGVAPNALSAKEEDRPPGPLRVLIGARFDQGKGHRFALEAMAQLKERGVNVLLHCAGDGPLKRTLEKYATALDVQDRVHFLGLVDHEELLDQLRARRWDVALLPSIETSEQREGIPVFLMEAMAAGIPVVATNTGGIPELLGDGAGMSIPQQDASAIADALARLATDENLRRRLSDDGIQRVHDHFNVESTVTALLDQIVPKAEGFPFVHG
jgi:glycosyltransferase involved in cell wall biosynthesis